VIVITLDILMLVSTAIAQNITVHLTSPIANTRFDVCQDIQFSADAIVQTGEVKRVEFYVNDKRLKSDTKAPYEFTWTSVPDGIYKIVAIGVDDQDAQAATDPIFVYVGNVQDGNMIINGEFNCQLSPWFLDNYVNAVSTITMVPNLWLTDDSSGVVVEIENQGDEVWAIQLMQPFKILKGHTYAVTFTAQADEAKEISVDISKNYDDYAPLHSAKFVVEDLEEYGPFEFEAQADDDNLMFKFVLGGNTIPIEIDAVNCIDKAWTSVENRSQPHSFELLPNYPNPFNPRTTIDYKIKKAGNVSLSIYNVMGQLVTSLTEFELSGPHSFVWDGKTSAGIDCPSGLYFYCLVVEEKKLTRKMHLLR
jgi:hypothetical protein